MRISDWSSDGCSSDLVAKMASSRSIDAWMRADGVMMIDIGVREGYGRLWREPEPGWLRQAPPYPRRDDFASRPRSRPGRIVPRIDGLSKMIKNCMRIDRKSVV